MLFSRTQALLAEESWRPWRSAESTRLIYHYTTAAGLHGIVTQRKFRLTHTRHLNDETEGLYGAVAVSKSLERLSARFPDNQLIEVLSDAMKFALENQQVATEGGTFVGCFSIDGDSLPQWRGYGRNDSAFSLEFDAGELLSIAGSAWDGCCWLLPVEYDEAAFISKMERALEIAAEEFESHRATEPPQTLIKSLVLHLANYGSALKHPAFREEREWRLIVLQLAAGKIPVCHLPSATFRPFIELEISKEAMGRALRRVIVGPQLTQDATAHGVVSFLREQLSVDVPVVRSEVPFNARV